MSVPFPPNECWEWLKTDRNTVLTIDSYFGQLNRGDYDAWARLDSLKIEAILDAFVTQWPAVNLPSSYGSSSPKGEVAYRFLRSLVWKINTDSADQAIPVLQRLLANPQLLSFHFELKSVLAEQTRKQALIDFEPPTPEEIVTLIDQGSVVTVEGLRQLLIDELEELQRAIVGGEFNSVEHFYKDDERLGEVRSTEIIAERLNIRLQPQLISITPEHHLKSNNRCDFTATKMIAGSRKLLVTEVKGQWNNELYTAALEQLHDRYAIHPDAEQQGIYLVLWFGAQEKIAGRIKHTVQSAQELKESLEASLPAELEKKINVFVLDVSR